MKYKEKSIPIFLLIALGTFTFMVQNAQAGRFEFTSSISLEETYDDNIFLTAGNEEDDLITSLTPMFSFSYHTRRTSLSSTYSPELRFYAENSDENEVDLGANPNADIDFNSRLTKKLRVSVRDSLVYTTAQQVARPETETRMYPSDQLNNDFSTTFYYQLFDPTTIRLGVAHSLEEYDRSELEDSYEYSYYLGIGHMLTARDSLSIDYRRRELFTEEEEEAEIQSISIGERHLFPQNLSLSVSGGIVMIDEEDVDQESNWRAEVSLSKEFRTATMGLAYNRWISADEEIEGMTVNQRVSLSGRKDITDHLDGDFTCFFSTEKSITGNEIDYRNSGLTLGTNYDFTRNLTGTVSFSYVYQNSKGLIGMDNVGYRGRVEATYLFRPGFRAFSSYRYYHSHYPYQAEEDIRNNLISAGIELTWL